MTGYVFAITAAILWGLTYTLDEIILAKITLPNLMIISAVMTLIVYIPFIDIKNIGTIANNRNDTILLLATNAISIAASAMIMMSISKLNAAAASIIEISYPIFVTIFSLLILDSSITPRFVVGALVAIAGIAIART